MENFSLILHVGAAALFIGPQVLLFFAVIPATWLIDDERLRRDVTMVVTRRFTSIAGASLVLLLATGLYQFYSVTPEAITTDMTNYRFGWLFIVKMTLFVIVLALVALHIRISRNIGQLADQVIAGEGDAYALEAARRRSFIMAALMLAVSLAILAFGVMLGRPEFAYFPN